MQNNVNSNISWYEGHTITSLGKISKFSQFYVQNIWQVVRWWHHQLTHLHIHIDWSRNVLWKFAKLQSVITSLFFNRFSSGFHCLCLKIFTLSSEIKLNLLWSSSFQPVHRLPRPAPTASPRPAPRVSGRPERQPDASWQFRRLAFSRSKPYQARSAAPHFHAQNCSSSIRCPAFSRSTGSSFRSPGPFFSLCRGTYLPKFGGEYRPPPPPRYQAL